MINLALNRDQRQEVVYTRIGGCFVRYARWLAVNLIRRAQYWQASGNCGLVEFTLFGISNHLGERKSETSDGVESGER